MPKRKKALPDGPYTIKGVDTNFGAAYRMSGPRLSRWGTFGELQAIRMMLNIAYAEGAKSAKKGRK